MKLLNLDEIALDSERTVKYQGKDYKVTDFNVTEFIAFQNHFAVFREAYNSQNTEDLQKVLSSTVELVKIGVPDFPLAEVEKLNPLQMLALVSMIANLMPEPDAETTEVVAASKKPRGAKKTAG